MILPAIALAAQATVAHPRENPVTVVERIDHYHYCLSVNYAAVRGFVPAPQPAEAARRATVRCWPVENGLRSAVIAHLARDGRGRDANARAAIAERMSRFVASAFALEAGVSLEELGPLSADQFSTGSGESAPN